MAKVSICIPAYENEQAVRRLLESIEKQIFKDYEVIITDDSENDSVEKLAGEKEYVRYYRNAKRLGSTVNWNEAIKKSSGEYIKIMHHDDWFTDENSLQYFVDILEEHPEADMAFSGTVQAEEGRDFKRAIGENDLELIRKDYRNLFLGNTIGSPSAVITRRKTGEYDENLKWLVDTEYYMRILKNNRNIAYTDNPLVSIGIGEAQLTEKCRDDKELNRKEYSYIYKKYDLETEKKYRDKLIKVYADGGNSYSEIKTYGIEAKEYSNALKWKFLSKVNWKLKHCITEKRIAFLALLFLALSLVPILLLAGVNHATGDDLGYGLLTHTAWVTEHSFPAVIKAACETVRNYYNNWQGTWFSVFIFALQPEVFSPQAYVIVPFLMLILWIVSTGLLIYYLLVKIAGNSRFLAVLMGVLLLSAGIQFIPSTKSSIFWYNGAAHYLIPYTLALTGIYLFLRFMTRDKAMGSFAGMTLCLFLVGGGNYLTALFALLVIILLLPVFYIARIRRNRICISIIPVFFAVAGLAASIIAPGNSRRGGEDFGFHIDLVIRTILICFERGFLKAKDYVGDNTLLLTVFAAAAFLAWRASVTKKEKMKYPYPLLFIIISYCIYCATFAPEIYAGVTVSGGVNNINYLVFLLMIFGDIIYTAGWFAYRTDRKQVTAKEHIAAFAVMAVLLIACKGNIKDTTSYACIEYIRSGQAADFKEQMDEHLAIFLDEEIKDAVVPFINDNQGPLMHMPVTADKMAWTNTTVSKYYGKDSIVAISRD